MTAVIHIWDQPTPTSWTEARTLAARLAGQAAAPNPKFIELARRMDAAFPEFRSESLEAPDGRVDSAVWDLDVEDPVRLYPRIVDAALELGLTIYDDESETCFVPGGWCLTPQGRERVAWPAPPSAAALLEPEPRVRALVAPGLAAHGFRLEVEQQSEYWLLMKWWRDTPLGKQWIRVDWKRTTPTSFEVHLWAFIEPRLPDELRPLCSPQSKISLRIVDTPRLRPFFGLHQSRGLFRNPIAVSGAGPLDELSAALSAWLEADMVPVMDQCRTVPDFLAYDLGEPRPLIAIEPFQSNLVLAHGAGAPDVEQRFESLLQRYEHHNGSPYFLHQTHRALQEMRGA